MASLLTDLSALKLVLYAVGLYTAYWWISFFIQDRKIKRLGFRAPRRTSWAPFGLDFLIDGVRHALDNDNLKLWHRSFLTWGNSSNPYTFESYALGQRLILTADPENIKAILATQFNDYGKGPRFRVEWHEFLGNGIFAADGKTWQESRQLIRPQFVKDRVSDLETFERHVAPLIARFGGQGQTIDVKDLFFRFTLDAATDFLFGRSIDSLKNESTEFAHAFGEIQRIQSLIARAGPAMFLVGKKEFRKHLRVLNDFCQPFIDEALSLPPEELQKRSSDSGSNYTFLHAIAAYTRDPVVLRDQLVSILLAGRDTTACTLSWLFFELSRNPQVVEKLRQEISDNVGMQNTPTYADLKRMRYLQYTLNETLRLYPVVPFNVRVALKDTTLPRGGGPDGNSPVGVLTGTPVGYSTQYMQLRSDLYPAPSEKVPPFHLWHPDRWYHWQPANWTYIPFNGGPRICVGQQFALTEMAYTVVRVLQKFSRVENKIDETSAVPNAVENNGKPDAAARRALRSWSRKVQNEESLVEKVVRGTDQVGQKSEIVLQPDKPVHVAFYE